MLRVVDCVVPVVICRPAIAKIGVGAATFITANALCGTPAQCMEEDLSLADFVADLPRDIVDVLVNSPPHPAAAAAAAAAAADGDGAADSPQAQPQLSVDRELIKIGKSARTELLDGTIIDIGKPGTLTANKVLLEFDDKKAAKKRKRDTDPVPKLQRWIPMELLTHITRASPARTTPAQPVPTAASAPRDGPLFPEAEPTSGPAVRATRPSVGEAGGSMDPMPQMAAHERARAMPQKPATKGGKKPQTKGIVRGPGKANITPETNVPISKRIAEHPGQSLIEQPKGSLFCRCCPQSIKNIAQTIKTHVNSEDHKAKLLTWFERNGEDEAIKTWLQEYYGNHPNEAMASVSEDDKLYRWRVVEAMLAAGVAINKVDELRPLLERAQNSLTSSQNLKVFIPKIETREVEQLIKEVAGQRVTIIFDGTTRLGEALVVLLRWIPADFSKVEQRLIAFRTTFKHTSGAELAKLLMSVLLTTMKLLPNHIVGGARDSCSTNGVAMRTIKAVLSNMQDFMCISHTLSHTGEHVELSTLNEFMTPWLSLVQNHPAAKTEWKNSIGTAMVGYSTIRWCSREEVQNEIAANFGALGDFLQTLIDHDIGDAHPRKMLKIYNEQTQKLEAELALSLDLEVIIQTVYKLEGDGLLILLARSKIDALLAFGSTVGNDHSSLPNLAAVLRKNTELKKKVKIHEWYGAPHNTWFDGEVKDVHRGGKVAVKYTDGSENLLEPHEAQAAVDVRPLAEWKRLVQEVKNGIGYLRNRLTGNCEPNYDCTQIFEVYRLVQAFDPSFAAQYVDAAWVDALATIPPRALTHLDGRPPRPIWKTPSPDLEDPLARLGHGVLTHPIRIRFVLSPVAEHVPRLKYELPAYLSTCAGTTYNHDDVDAFTQGVLLFWANHGKKFPTWALAMQIVGSFTPNSAAAEHVFSLLKLNVRRYADVCAR